MRYWLMLVVLVAATAGMAGLSHGEATPLALPLAQFPKQVLTFNDVADVPMSDHPFSKELPSRSGLAADA
jgi:hypothetical protein